MHNLAKKYFENLARLMRSVHVTDSDGNSIDFYKGVEKAGELIINQTASGKKLIFIGNGASAAFASHMSTDFWKNGGMRAIAFNDSSLLTCIGNDYGFEHLFEKPVEMFAETGDLLIPISSSGKSENILLAVKAANEKNCEIITFSGFSPDNPLSKTGSLNFYIPNNEYGLVEVMHQAILHCILDVILQKKPNL